jgi:hypothetical protein
MARRGMGLYPSTAAERAMKIQEVILRAASGAIRWVQAAEILGVAPQHMRRWRERCDADGYSGCWIVGAGIPARTGWRLRRSSRSCSCTGSATLISTCGIFMKSCAKARGDAQL